MKLCISKIHLGRYRIEWLDDDHQILSGTDGGLALVYMCLTDWLARPEHAQYEFDQRKSSDELGKEAIQSLRDTATPEQRKILDKHEATRGSRYTKLLRNYLDSDK